MAPPDDTEPESKEVAPAPPAVFSTAGLAAAALVAALVLSVAVASLAIAFLPLPPWTSLPLGLLAGLPVGLWTLGRLLRPATRRLHGLADGLRGFGAREFSLRLQTTRRDEIGELVRL